MNENKIPEISGDAVIDIALDTISIGKQAIVFAGTKRSAEKQAEEISIRIKEHNDEWDEISSKAEKSLSHPTKQCERLAKCLKKGIAFHHSGLVQKQRELIERKFRDGAVKVICCTPTLAAGVDLPAFRVIIKDVKRYGGKSGMSYIPVLEYLQMAGRAGRPKFDSFGEAVLIAKSESEERELENRYIYGEPEDIFSKLAVEPVLRTAILSLVASGFVSSRKEIMNFFERTFWAYQFEDMWELESKIEMMLDLLVEWQMLNASDESDFVAADSLDSDRKYSPTSLGRRVSELYIDPFTARSLVIDISKAAKKPVLREFSFIHSVSSSLEMRPLLRLRSKEYEFIEEKIAELEPYLLSNEPSVYELEHEEFMDSFKTALMLMDWCDEKGEEKILEEYNARPGELRVKIETGRWLLYCSEEIARIAGFMDIIREIRKARLRLAYGVKEELLPLLRLEGVGRARARRLYSSRLRNLADIKKSDISSLVAIVGKSTATRIKEQLGEKVDKDEIIVPKRKRKGQLSLEKF